MALCPFADQSRRYDANYGGRYVGGPWRGVLHTTETTGLPGYGSGKTAPHLTVDPRRRKTWQHYDTARPGRALKHPKGTIDTNNLSCVQIEVVAYSDEKKATQVGGLAVSQLTADDYAYLASVMRWVESEHPIQPTSGLRWKAYPSSAGTSNGVRMNDAEWRAFNGWCGHQHVPHNQHGDPSNLNIQSLLEDDMPLTAAEKNEIADLTVSKLLRASLKNSHDGTVASLAAWVVYGNEKAGLARDNSAAGIKAVDDLRAALNDTVAKAATDAVKAAIADGTLSIAITVNGAPQ